MVDDDPRQALEQLGVPPSDRPDPIEVPQSETTRRS